MKFQEALKKAKKSAKQTGETCVIWKNNSSTRDYLVLFNGELPIVSDGNGSIYSQLLLVTPSGTISQ